jgi:photosystem II stability/assembly factor-like uncharacterized protein
MKMNKYVISFVLLVVISINGQWIQLQSGTTLNLNSVFFLNDKTGWVCGDSGIVLKTSDGGMSWNSYATSHFVNLLSIHFCDSLHGVAVGTKSSIFATNDGGIIWSLKNINPDINFNAVKFIDSAKILVVGNSGKILLSTDRGNNWQTIPDPPPQNLLNISFLDMNFGFIGGDEIIKKTTDGGNSWITMGSRDDTKMVLINNMFFWKIGWSWPSGIQEPRQYIEKTTNGGISWEIQYMTIGNNLQSIQMYNLEKGFVLNYFGVVLVTTNGGTQWLRQEGFPNIRLNEFNFVDSSTGWIVGNAGLIFKTTNAGGIYTGVEDDKNRIINFTLFQNYPNPFNPTTKIKFTIPSNVILSEAKNLFVSLKVYDVLGREVATLVNEEKQPGVYEVEFDASQLSSGIYFYTLEAGEFRDTKKLIFLK